MFIALTMSITTGCKHEPPAAQTAPARASSTPDLAPQRTLSGATHVSFPSHDADLTKQQPTTLDAWLMRPEGAGPFPAIIFLHGCAGLYRKSGTEIAPREHEYAERFVKQGYVVLMPDSFTPRGVDEICSRHDRTVRAFYERNRDAYGALVWLESQPFTRADRIGLLGWSNGGITVLGTIAHETQSRPAALAHDFRVAVAFYPDCRQALRRAEWSPPVAPLHILIGEKDDWTPASPCVDLVSDAQGHGATIDIVVYPDAYHDFDDPEMQVHVRHNVATTDSGTATIGMNPAARADAIERVTRIFHDALSP